MLSINETKIIYRFFKNVLVEIPNIKHICSLLVEDRYNCHHIIWNVLLKKNKQNDVRSIQKVYNACPQPLFKWNLFYEYLPLRFSTFTAFMCEPRIHDLKHQMCPAFNDRYNV